MPKIAIREAQGLPVSLLTVVLVVWWSLHAKPGLFPYERVHFSQGTQIAGELVSGFRQVHTG